MVELGEDTAFSSVSELYRFIPRFVLSKQDLDSKETAGVSLVSSIHGAKSTAPKLVKQAVLHFTELACYPV